MALSLEKLESFCYSRVKIVHQDQTPAYRRVIADLSSGPTQEQMIRQLNAHRYKEERFARHVIEANTSEGIGKINPELIQRAQNRAFIYRMLFVMVSGTVPTEPATRILVLA